MHAIRTRFAKEIVAEVMPPAKHSRKVIILIGGFPASPCAKPVMTYYAKKGYWVVYPRLRGTWESDGVLFEKSPHEDVIDVINELPYGFTCIHTGKEYTIDPGEINLLGPSFGGATVLLASQDERVRKVAAFAPVVDWTAESQEESFSELERVAKEGYGPVFRMSEKGMKRVEAGELFQPKAAIENLDPDKICIFQAEDDKVVSPESVKKFAEELGCKFVMSKTGGHYGRTTTITHPFNKKVLRWFKK